MTATRPKNLTRALVGLLSLGVLAAPALVPSVGTAGTQDAKFRKVSAPNVFYPVIGSRQVSDLRTTSKSRVGTDIATRCDAGVYATHPGKVTVIDSNALGNYVRVAAGSTGLATGYGYLSRVLVTDGQIVQSGQALGYVGQNPDAECRLYFSVGRNGKSQNPTWWLNRYVGKTPPVGNLFDTRGFTVASYNVLGASHTRNSRKFASGNARLNRSMTMLNARKVDVVGTQEFQETQFDHWVRRGNQNAWGAYYWDPAGKRRDTENAIIWRKETMEFVSGETFDIPYFSGNIRHVPAVLLREKSTGRTAYFLNVHNPANVRGNAATYRARAIAIEKQKMIDLRATGRPVFLMGDFNDRAAAFCPLTQNKLSISPNSIPSNTCRYPKQSSIDWIFAAGQVRFSSFVRDTYPQKAKISDHPIVQTRAHLQD